MKAQTGVEYLLILGGVIIVFIIVAALYIGIEESGEGQANEGGGLLDKLFGNAQPKYKFEFVCGYAQSGSQSYEIIVEGEEVGEATSARGEMLNTECGTDSLGIDNQTNTFRITGAIQSNNNDCDAFSFEAKMPFDVVIEPIGLTENFNFYGGKNAGLIGDGGSYTITTINPGVPSTPNPQPDKKSCYLYTVGIA